MQTQKFVMRFIAVPEIWRLFTHDFVEKSRFNLKISEFKTLMHLHRVEGKPMGFYGHKVDVEKGSFTYLVDKLEKKGFVKRVFVEGDRRQKRLILTEEGHEVTKQIHQQFSAHFNKKLEQLSGKDQQKLYKALEMLDEVRSVMNEQ